MDQPLSIRELRESNAMDPDILWQLLLTAINHEERELAVETLDLLRIHLHQGGAYHDVSIRVKASAKPKLLETVELPPMEGEQRTNHND